LETNNITNTPQVTSDEVKQWENKFRESITPQVQFEVPDNGKPSMQFYNGESGIEASWSGTIILTSDNYIKWSFSIQNGLFIDCKLNLNEEILNIVKKLSDFYNIWKEEWGKQITIPDENRDDTEMVAGGAPNPVQPAAATPGAGADTGMNPTLSPDQIPGPVNENNRSKQTIIRENRERMMRLANLWKSH